MIKCVFVSDIIKFYWFILYLNFLKVNYFDFFYIVY